MTGQSVIYQDNRMFSSAKKNKAMQRYGGNLNSYYQVKEANVKRLQFTWFPLYDILEKTNCKWKWKKAMVPGVMVKRGWINETQRTFQDLKLFSMRSKSDQIDLTILLLKPTECTTSRMINVQTAFWVIIIEQSESLYQMQHFSKRPWLTRRGY